jgi:hypothetical protein
VAGQPPTIEQAMEHQRRWGENRTMAQQLADIAGKTGETAWNALPSTIGAKWMERQMQTDPRQNDPEAVRGAADVALSTVGAGMLGAERGALGAAGGKPRIFYRGEVPGDIRRISTGNPEWDQHTFASSNLDSAKMYGPSITTFEAKPDAKILYEGTREFTKIAGKWRKGESLLDYSSRAAQSAKKAGYDATWFQRQGDVGTAIHNPDAFIRNQDSQGIRAYHGSPHDFEKFDVSKIGTGEGAQAYGHGLYFAENPKVAESYKGTVPNGLSPWNIRNAWTPAELPSGKGKMYEVSIKAHPDEFLDWDKPLSEQHPKVREAIDKFYGLPSEGAQKTMTGEDLSRALHANSAREIYTIKGPDGRYKPAAAKTKEDAIKEAGGDPSRVQLVRNPDPSVATEQMREAGIPGIKYLDQGSRGNTRWLARHPQGGINDFADEKSARAFVAKNPEYSIEAPKQTSNYVVFHHDLIDIMKKYGLAGLSALPAAGAYHFRDADIGKK